MRIRGRLLGGLALAALCLPAGSAVAAPGELDPAFGNGGRSTVDLGGNDFATNLLLQPDGKVIVTGDSNAANPPNLDLIAARLLVPQGTLDPSYGGGFGWSTINFGGDESGGASVLQADGRIIVAGKTDPFADYGVARLLNPEGTFDSSFGSGGFRTGVLGGSDNASAVTLQPDGRIVFAGSSSGPGGADWLIGRLLNPQATPDGSFGSGGFVTRNFGGSADEAQDVAIQPDGKILVAGAQRNTGEGYGFGAVARLLPGGTPDGSFGNGGDVTSLGDAAFSLALQPDGKIIAAGTDSFNSTVFRLNPNGGLDESFGGDGRSGVVGFSSASEVIVQPDGKIIVVGAAVATGVDEFGVARLQPNGLIDTTFGNGGKTTIGFGATFGMPQANAVVQQPDGKIIVTGTSEGNIALARLQGDPPGEVNEKCAGKRATILGTNAKDKLKGTKKRDVVSAGKGNDTVKGLGGNDLICGGKGKDGLFGGAKKDTLLGEAGKDRLFGGPAKDTLKGGKGKDLMVGGPAKDKLNGGPGKDAAKQ